MPTSPVPQLRRRLAVSLLSGCLVTVVGPVVPAAVGSRAAPSSSVSASTETVPVRAPVAQRAQITSTRPIWPSGETAGGGRVTWSVRPARHAAFRHSTRWWGAAGTRVRIRGPRARHVYAFRMRLPRHVSLRANRFGEVMARRHGHPVGILARPWARNARGHRVKTWYTVRGDVVRQHVVFGRHSRYPITADPWWNPFTWRWGEAFRVAWDEVTTCGEGAMRSVLSVGGTTGTTNLLIKHVAGRTALMIPGGAYTYAGFAAWGCIGSFF